MILSFLSSFAWVYLSFALFFTFSDNFVRIFFGKLKLPLCLKIQSKENILFSILNRAVCIINFGS